MFYFISIIDSGSENLADNLKSSIENLGYNLTLLTNYNQQYGNFSKIIYVSQYLETLDLNDDDVIFYIDSYDCLMTGDPMRTLEYLIETNTDVLFSTEKGYDQNTKCWQPAVEYFQSYSQQRGFIFRGLCAGAFCGRARKLRDFLVDMRLVLNDWVLEMRTRWEEIFGMTFPKRLLLSDQFFITYYLWRIDFVNYKKISINLDCFDKIFFTYNWDIPELNIQDYVFIHIYSLGIPIQKMRYSKVLKILNSYQKNF